MAEYEFTIMIEQDEDGRFLAICPALQGCYTEGEIEEEVRELIKTRCSAPPPSLDVSLPGRAGTGATPSPS